MILLSKSAPGLNGWVCKACRSSRDPVNKKNVLNYATQTAYRKPSQQLPKFPARTRFAPSPTGYLHLGSLRTALYNYLLAKATGGQFLLRIEDTDQKRTVSGAEGRIFRDLEWVGLQCDEGPEVGGPCGPYRQSERTAVYQEHAQKLLDTGHAYRCFCSAERLKELTHARSQLGLPTDYDRACAGVSKEESDQRAHDGDAHVVRLRVPDKYPVYHDLVYGRVGGTNRQSKKYIHGERSFEDPILLKSDGLPTYHLANVVDDHLMKITHVIRASEWMPSTPKHLFMYEAFGWQPPAYAHVGLLQDNTKQKLSKRNMDGDFVAYRKDGIFPETLLNFVALLGWSHTLGSDILTLQDLIHNFDLKFTKGDAITSFQKLNYLQKNYAIKYAEEGGTNFEDMVARVLSIVEQKQAEMGQTGTLSNRNMKDLIAAILKVDAKSYYPLETFFERHKNFFLEEPDYNEADRGARFDNDLSFRIQERLAMIPESNWTADQLQSEIRKIVSDITSDENPISEEERAAGEKRVSSRVIHFLRQEIMGSKAGPAMSATMEILGRERTLSRLRLGSRDRA